MRLIDADKLNARARAEYGSCLDAMQLQQFVSKEPTVDAVPIVRCGECVHAHLKCQECDALPQELIINPNFYCPYGKREEKANVKTKQDG